MSYILLIIEPVGQRRQRTEDEGRSALRPHARLRGRPEAARGADRRAVAARQTRRACRCATAGARWSTVRSRKPRRWSAATSCSIAPRATRRSRSPPSARPRSGRRSRCASSARASRSAARLLASDGQPRCAPHRRGGLAHGVGEDHRRADARAARRRAGRGARAGRPRVPRSSSGPSAACRTTRRHGSRPPRSIVPST